MKNKLIDIIILCIISGVISIACTWCVYNVFPQFLCYAVYDVHESNLQEKEDKPVSGQEYVETFVPVNSYIKTIAISVTTEDNDDVYEDYIVGKLIDNNGKTLAQDKYEISSGMSLEYCEFEFEKWVMPGEEYQFVLTFPEREDVLVTFCSLDAGPVEHVSLQGGQQSDVENMYMRYVYGTYSKKLLAIWLLGFFIGAYFVVEQISHMLKGKRTSKESMVRG